MVKRQAPAAAHGAEPDTKKRASGGALSAAAKAVKRSGKALAGKPGSSARRTQAKRKGVPASIHKAKRKHEDGAAEGTKDGKFVTGKVKKRKEVTSLYAELINPGREASDKRKPDAVVGEILELLESRAATFLEYCCTELGSRVVQACLKWGSNIQRRQLLVNLREHLPKLALDRYGHVVTLKLLRYAMRTSKDRKPTAEERKTQAQNLREFLEGFRGKPLHTAFFHKNGCRVINGIFFSDVVSAKEKRRLFHDVAVPQAVSLTRPELPGSCPLRKLLCDKDLKPEHQAAMMKHVREALDRSVDKELLNIDIVHLLFQAYCESASEDQLRDLAEKCMAGAPYLLSSKPGAEALLRLLGVASAKQRKALIRDLKGKFSALAMNAVDYVFLIRLASTVDDTVLLGKAMLGEWIPDLADLCFDKYGHRVLAWFLRPDDPRLFSPYERESAALPAPASLKAPETRRQELVRILKPPLRVALLANPLKFVADQYAKDLLLAYMAADWDAEIIEGIISAGEAEREHEELGLLGSGVSVTTLLALLKAEPVGDADGGLAAPLWRRCFESRLAAAVTSRCAFVLLALLKRTDATRDKVLKALRKQKPELEAAVAAAAKAGANISGARKLLDEAAA